MNKLEEYAEYFFPVRSKMSHKNRADWWKYVDLVQGYITKLIIDRLIVLRWSCYTANMKICRSEDIQDSS